MGKFNVYRMIKDKELQLIEKLNDAGLTNIKNKMVNEFKLSFYLSQNPDEISIWWTQVYSEYIEDENTPKNKAYFAVLLLSNNESLYAISLGKSHFYLTEFCDIDFGIDLAERIIDPTQLKLKNSKLFGGKKNKTITSYLENSEFEYDSGESIHFIKAKTINPSKWGKTANFGNSVLFNLNRSPDDLPYLIKEIENILSEQPKIILPRSTLVKDSDSVLALDKKLIEEILNNYGFRVQSQESTVSGVDFIFLDKSQYQYIYNGKSFSIDGDISIESLKLFINENQIDLTKDIDKIKVKVLGESTKGYTKNLKYFLDFVDDDRHCLIDGKWHAFNQNYLEFLKSEIDSKIIFQPSTLNLSQAAYMLWKHKQSLIGNRLDYKENYFNHLRESDGYINFDRDMEQLNKFKIEKLDLYKDETAYFVKIGTPQKIGYVVDQAMATIKILQNKTTRLIINDKVTKPKKICLWIILDRLNKINALSQINSLILLIKLAEWQKQCTNAGYQAIVMVGYKVP